MLTHPTLIRRLFTNELNNVSPDDYLTIGTDQKIDSNVFISKVHVNEIRSNVINNMPNFAENVVLLGRDNIINSKADRLYHLEPFIIWNLFFHLQVVSKYPSAT